MIRVQTEDFDITAETRALCQNRTDIGGLASFIGTVRGTAKGREITGMTLEHYPGMTEKSLQTIATEATTRFNLQATTIIHRVGHLTPGDQIVLVLTAAPHRHEALEACAYLIDWLKTSAPFWKAEHFPDGTTQWVDAREADTQAKEKWTTLPQK